MEQLGIYECDEEDFSLCSFVCQSKFPVHQVIREGLELIEQEGRVKKGWFPKNPNR